MFLVLLSFDRNICLSPSKYFGLTPKWFCSCSFSDWGMLRSPDFILDRLPVLYSSWRHRSDSFLTKCLLTSVWSRFFMSWVSVMVLKFVGLTAKCYHKYMTNLLQASF